MKYFFNSAVVAISTSIIVILLGTLTAYGILIYRSKLGEYFSVFMILGKLVPTITILIPLYIMMNKMGLTGTYFAPIIAHSVIQLPFITWLMLSFMRGLPKELYFTKAQKLSSEGEEEMMLTLNIDGSNGVVFNWSK
ncbi:MAG: hypothetical protein CVU95_03365 [Firmicutes bacterium HGW-Firmicutes-2]|nr:MAG: hypothetical protein CVU95_03365 [Firmicutes bacterium HGW-Firmicutes-2]